jgi:hypothetical protein
MANLFFVTFTEVNDEIVAPVVGSISEGWFLGEGQRNDSLAGNDTIAGGLLNNGTLLTNTGDDAILAPGYRGVINNQTGTINTGTGSDRIIITRVSDYNQDLKNYGLINLGSGNDTLSISGESTLGGPRSGFENFVNGRILTGSGNDAITVNVPGTNIRNLGTIDTGTGNDRISCNDFLENAGRIVMGDGADSLRITSPVSRFLVAISNTGSIDTGSGDDSIVGTAADIGFFPMFTTSISNGGTILTGSGNDRLSGVGGNYGLSNRGTINTGDGNDILTGGGATKGIENNGMILTGRGRDTINALQGGFSGTGTTNLGADSDSLRGFGTGIFQGGPGSDSLVFNPGTYTITAAAPGIYHIITPDAQMTVSGFERFGPGANVPLFAQAVLAGQVIFS